MIRSETSGDDGLILELWGPGLGGDGGNALPEGFSRVVRDSSDDSGGEGAVYQGSRVDRLARLLTIPARDVLDEKECERRVITFSVRLAAGSASAGIDAPAALAVTGAEALGSPLDLRWTRALIPPAAAYLRWKSFEALATAVTESWRAEGMESEVRFLLNQLKSLIVTMSTRGIEFQIFLVPGGKDDDASSPVRWLRNEVRRRIRADRLTLARRATVAIVTGLFLVLTPAYLLAFVVDWPPPDAKAWPLRWVAILGLPGSHAAEIPSARGRLEALRRGAAIAEQLAREDVSTEHLRGLVAETDGAFPGSAVPAWGDLLRRCVDARVRLHNLKLLAQAEDVLDRSLDRAAVGPAIAHVKVLKARLIQVPGARQTDPAPERLKWIEEALRADLETRRMLVDWRRFVSDVDRTFAVEVDLATVYRLGRRTRDLILAAEAIRGGDEVPHAEVDRIWVAATGAYDVLELVRAYLETPQELRGPEALREIRHEVRHRPDARVARIEEWARRTGSTP